MKGRLPLKLSVTAIVILTILALLPQLVNAYWLHISIRTLWLVYLSVAWTIAGRAHVLDLCHSTFVGVGAYTSTLLFLKLDVSPWLGMLVGMAIALLVALFIGWLCFRAQLQLLPFVMVTLAFAVIVTFLALSLGVTGGAEGLRIMRTASNSWNFQWVSKLPYYYLILGMTVLVVVIYRLIDRSKLGIYFKAIADNERGAAAIGIDIMRYKLIAIGISAILAALAGTFWAQYSSYVEPNSYLGPQLVLMLLLFAAVGGMASTWGPVVAPLVLAPLSDIFNAYLGSRYTGSAPILYGVLICLVILFLPRGVITWVEERFRKST